ncbi:MAG: alpha/beta hydrolase [Rhodobacterales bacterium]|nr:alpha/beta hydrolase [Rhodobacterales bacterium]
MLQIAVLFLIAYGLVVLALYLGQRAFVYQPDSRVPVPEDSYVPEMEVVRPRAADGQEGMSWFHPPRPGFPTLVYFHGNAGHIGSRGYKVRPFMDAGWGAMLVEYRGYGGNPGKPTEQGLYADGRAALRYLESRAVAPGTWVLYGESLGTGVAVQMARDWADAGTPAGALVLEAPFDSVTEVAKRRHPYAPVRWLLLDRFDSAAKIAGVRTAVMVAHGDADRTVGQARGRALFAAAVEPKEAHWIPDANHSNIFERADMVVRVTDLARRRGLVPDS